MTQPAAEQLLNLADRAERHALTPDEAARLRDGLTHHCARAEKAEAERDRYRFAWNSARDRAQALGEGVLRHVDDLQWTRGKLLEAQTEATTERTRAETAEAAIERVRALASRWAILRAYGSATTELRAALDLQEPQQ